MKKIPILSFTVFLVLIIISIVIFNINNDAYGKSFIDQVRIADSDSTLVEISDENLVSLGKTICESSNKWFDENSSLDVIQRDVSSFGLVIDVDDRIIQF